MCENHIKHKTIKNHVPVDPEDVDFDIDKDFDEVYVINYDIMVDTTLEMFDYIKWVIEKRIKLVVNLNKIYYKKQKKKVSKKQNDTRTIDIRK